MAVVFKLVTLNALGSAWTEIMTLNILFRMIWEIRMIVAHTPKDNYSIFSSSVVSSQCPRNIWHSILIYHRKKVQGVECSCAYDSRHLQISRSRARESDLERTMVRKS